MQRNDWAAYNVRKAWTGATTQHAATLHIALEPKPLRCAVPHKQERQEVLHSRPGQGVIDTLGKRNGGTLGQHALGGRRQGRGNADRNYSDVLRPHEKFGKTTRRKCLLYQRLLPLYLFLSLLLQFLHRLRQGKNTAEMFQSETKHSRVRKDGASEVVVCSITRSSYVAQIRFAYSYHIGIFRQSQASSVLTIFIDVSPMT